jgi:hypothetical protein
VQAQIKIQVPSQFLQNPLSKCQEEAAKLAEREEFFRQF